MSKFTQIARNRIINIKRNKLIQKLCVKQWYGKTNLEIKIRSLKGTRILINRNLIKTWKFKINGRAWKKFIINKIKWGLIGKGNYIKNKLAQLSIIWLIKR